MTKRAHGEGSLIRRKGCRFWYAQWYDATGEPIRVSTKEEVKQRALVKLRELMGKSEAGQPVADGKLKYADLREALLADYVTKGNKSLEQRESGDTVVGLPQLDEFAGFKPKNGDDPGNPGVPVSHLTTDFARAFTKKRTDDGVGPAMINRSLAALRRMLHIAYEDRKIAAVPKIRMSKEPPARRGFLERPKFDELLLALPMRLRPYVALLYWCGTRKGETRKVDWSQLDLDTRLITLHPEQTKGDEGRFIPLPSQVVDVLRRHEPKRGLVFDTTNLRVEWERACAKVGLATRAKLVSEAGNTYWKYDGLLIHDLRRSAVRNLRLAGASETVSMRISGHKTRHVFDRYNITTTDDITAAMRSVEVQAAKMLPEVSAKLVQKGRVRKVRNHGNPRK